MFCFNSYMFPFFLAFSFYFISYCKSLIAIIFILFMKAALQWYCILWYFQPQYIKLQNLLSWPGHFSTHVFCCSQIHAPCVCEHTLLLSAVPLGPGLSLQPEPAGSRRHSKANDEMHKQKEVLLRLRQGRLDSHRTLSQVHNHGEWASSLRLSLRPSFNHGSYVILWRHRKTKMVAHPR